MTTEIKIRVPMFSGFYDTIWGEGDMENVIEYLKEDGKLEKETREILNSFDGKNYREEVAKKFASIIMDNIKKEFENDTVFSINFAELICPKEYNFLTDVIFVTMEVDYAKFVKQLIEKAEKANIRDYITDNFESRNGFISFVSNNWNDWKEVLTNRGDKYEGMIAEILEFVLKDEELYPNETEDRIYEEMFCNGFTVRDFMKE